LNILVVGMVRGGLVRSYSVLIYGIQHWHTPLPGLRRSCGSQNGYGFDLNNYAKDNPKLISTSWLLLQHHCSCEQIWHCRLKCFGCYIIKLIRLLRIAFLLCSYQLFAPYGKGWGNWWGNVSTLQTVYTPTLNWHSAHAQWEIVIQRGACMGLLDCPPCLIPYHPPPLP
jgi:hypothetical protein